MHDPVLWSVLSGLGGVVACKWSALDFDDGQDQRKRLVGF